MIGMVIKQRRRQLGGGFEIGRVLPLAKRRMVGPFTFFDHIGPLDIAAGVDRIVDVRPHPHIGLSTVTYLFAGEMMHRDSLGYEQAVRPQEVNWMTAGRGITHSERLERARAQGDHLHGIQAWIALPTEMEEIAPSFSHHSGSDLPQWEDGGVIGQLIAGSAYGLTAGAETHSPLFYAHLDMASGATAEIPGGHKERALYVATGAVELDGARYEAGKVLVLGTAASRVRASERSAVMGPMSVSEDGCSADQKTSAMAYAALLAVFLIRSVVRSPSAAFAPAGPVQPMRARVPSSVERGTLKLWHTLALLAPPSRAETI